jgi:PAS domain S-box-containing protein
VFISESTGMPTLSLSIPTDYRIIVGYINLNKLTSIIENIQIGKDGYASIMDSTGTVIAHPDKNKFSQRVNISSLTPIKQALSGNPGTYIYHDNGENYIGSVSIVNPTNWIILISQSEKEAFAPVNNIQFLLIVFIIIAIFLAIIMSFLSLQIALKPLSLFTKATKTIAEGNYTNIALPHSYKEINELGENYSLMAQAIHVREKELKESEERYRLLFEKNADGIAVTDIDTKQFLYTNPSFYKMLGYTQEEILKLGVEDIHPEDKLEFIISEFNAQAKGEKTLIINIPCLKKNREVFYADINASPIIIKDKKYNLGIFRNVTERRLLEKLKKEKEVNEKILIRTQRLAALGELTTAFAHEIRQPLHIIRMITEGIIYWDDKNKEKNETYKKKLGNLSRVIKGIERIDDIITNIYTHTRQSKEIKIEPVNFNLIIQETIDFFGAKLKYHSIKIIFDLDPKVSDIIFSRSQAEQVITNLISNAINALDKINRNAKQISIKTQESNKYLLLEISDNGPGIDYKIKERIFNPLFTTRHETDSLGMGLYIVHNILKSFNGTIDVVNNESGGATFSIKFMRKQDKE